MGLPREVGSFKGAALRLLIVLVATAASGGIGSEAHARKVVVFMGVRGPQGGTAARIVSRALRRRYRVISRGKFVGTAKQLGVNYTRPSGRRKTARTLRVAGIVSGSIIRSGSRWVLKLVVHAGHSGRIAGKASFALRGTRVGPSVARRIPAGLNRAMSRARAGPPLRGVVAVKIKRPRRRRRTRPRKPRRVVARRQPAPAARQPRRGFDDGSDMDGNSTPAPNASPIPDYKTDPTPARRKAAADDSDSNRLGDDLGFEVGDEDSGDDEVPKYGKSGDDDSGDETSAEISRSSTKRPRWESIIEGSLGLMVINRSFEFNQPRKPADPSKHSNYHSGLVPAISFDLAAFPLAYVHRGPLANLGITGRYFRVLGLQSTADQNLEPLKTTLHAFELGLQYRWNILSRLTSPTLKAGVEFGRLGFVIWDTENNSINLPDIAYLYLKLALVGLEVPFYAKRDFLFGASGSFDFLLIFSAGDIERTSSPGYGRSITNGIDMGLGVFGYYKGFFLKVEGFYRRIFFDFDNACDKQQLGCFVAGGALDVYMGGIAKFGYSF